MVAVITRDADAARLLCPAGWEWYDRERPKAKTYKGEDIFGAYGDDKSWTSWAPAVVKMQEGLDHDGRTKAYEAMCALIVNYAVSVKVMAWRGSSYFKVPAQVMIGPLSTDNLDAYMRDYGSVDNDSAYTENLKASGTHNILNLWGWVLDGETIPAGKLQRASGMHLACHGCKKAHPGLMLDTTNPSRVWCTHCVRVCPGNSRGRCNQPVFESEFKGCEKHFPRSVCSNCARVCEIDSLGRHDGGSFCPDCLSTICQRCGQMGVVGRGADHVYDREERYRVCRPCTKEVVEWLRVDANEKVVLEKPCSMHIKAHKSRPVRMVSIELEMDSGAQEVLNELHDKGLTADNQIKRHWSNLNDFCYMERDGSLGTYGGELIFSKLRLDDQNIAAKLQEAIGILRKHVRKGNAVIDLKTGAHIHVDAHKMGFQHIRNLAAVHNYLEDVLYRLGAANYERHRGVHFASLLPKEGLDDQATFNRMFFNRGNAETQHHSVLNIAGYYGAARNCRCGNLLKGDPNACDCQLGKCTVEFRVFNGTSSWKKLHAYLALCLAMVAYAKDCDDVDVNDFPPLDFNAVRKPDDKLKHEWAVRLTWMFQNLYFTEEDRDTLNYCIEHSELGQMSYSVRKRLRQVQYKGIKYVPTKPPKQAKEDEEVVEDVHYDFVQAANELFHRTRVPRDDTFPRWSPPPRG